MICEVMRGERMKEKTKKVLLWMFVAFCFTAVLVYGLNIGSILILLCGIAAIPIEQVRNLWKKVLPDKMKWVKKARYRSLRSIEPYGVVPAYSYKVSRVS